MKAIFTVLNTSWAVVKIRPEKHEQYDFQYDFNIFTFVYSPLHGFIWYQHNDQLPVGLLAQLVERCTDIAEVMDSNSVQVWIFLLGLILTTAQVVFITAKITFIFT